MIIDIDWVMNYISQNGTNIMIPKEATEIANQAFNFYGTNYEGESIQIIFEEGSKLEKIGSMAFCTEVSNTILLPPSIRTIEEFAFYGYPISVRLPENSQIKVCDSDFVFCNESNIVIPENLEQLKLTSIVKHLESITIPDNSKLKKVIIENGVDKVIFPTGTELLSAEEKDILGVRLKSDKAMLIYNSKIYEIINLKDKSVIGSRKCVFLKS